MPSDPIVKELQRQLPLLPGYNFDFGKDLRHQRKSHTFDYCNGVPVFKQVPGIGGVPVHGQEKSKVKTSMDLYPHSDSAGEGVPAWVAFDRKVLRFYAYFQEAVHERRDEQYRVRKVNIYFYLEDDSVHVSEPRLVNSGIPQGTLIRRHRIPKAESELGQHYIVSDFNVGQEVTFYSRTFKIVGCDKFTRDFLQSLSFHVPPNGGFPLDPYTVVRDELKSRMRATRPRPPQTSLKKFLENDRRVLRFYCVWDDTNSVFGDLRQMVVHYYLCDDTIEIREHIPANSGRDSNTLFLRRSKLPKRMPSWLYGHNTDQSYYTERDFVLGAVLHLYGRPFVVCDCDEFTKEYYYEKYGVETFDPVRLEDFETTDADPVAADLLPKAVVQANYELLLPPSPLTPAPMGGAAAPVTPTAVTMIGASAPPKKDFKKLMLYDSVVLRFAAVLRSNRQVDRDRRFVVSLYVADDTVSVFEPKARNTGIVGGKFLEKQRIRKPDGVGFYVSEDFFIGAQLVFFHHPFVITGADEYAIKFMAAHPAIFPNHRSDTAAATQMAPLVAAARPHSAAAQIAPAAQVTTTRDNNLPPTTAQLFNQLQQYEASGVDHPPTPAPYLNNHTAHSQSYHLATPPRSANADRKRVSILDPKDQAEYNSVAKNYILEKRIGQPLNNVNPTQDEINQSLLRMVEEQEEQQRDTEQYDPSNALDRLRGGVERMTMAA
ncbi:hypothetical protein DFS34DRAFT_6512 [Phlyctochytrium arcticum]|nr:hypothetical protein DFS34DRAFT_6512 [Phlyctochytrium arcticum]